MSTGGEVELPESIQMIEDRGTRMSHEVGLEELLHFGNAVKAYVQAHPETTVRVKQHLDRRTLRGRIEVTWWPASETRGGR